MDCVFCKIARGEIPSEKIFEDEHTFAFLDISPNNHGHTLVVPKEHFKNILDISPHAFARVADTVWKIAGAVKAGVNADGLNITMNNEQCAGQIVFHAHMHIIPRYINDGLKVWHRKRPYKSESAMKEVGEKIRKHLQ